MEQDIAHTPGTVVCPSCGHSISYVDTANSTHFACGQCSTYFRGSDGSIIRKFLDGHKPEHMLDFGLKMRRLSTLIGVIRKRDPAEGFYWTEYLFYHPDYTYYITLADIDGYWIAVYPASEAEMDEIARDKLTDYNQPYMTYRADVVYAEGEFNWDMLQDERTEIREFMYNGGLLVTETTGSKIDIFIGSFLTPKHVADYLDIPLERLSARSDVDPAVLYPRWRAALRFTGLVVVLWVVWNIMRWMSTEPQVVFDNTFVASRDSGSWGANKSIVTPSFTLEQTGVFNINATAGPLSNSWVELEHALVNETTGKVYEASQSLESYSGYEDGESWSEGSHEGTVRFARVPPGKYHLNITTILPDDSHTALDVRVLATQDPSGANHSFIMLCLLLCYPAMLWYTKFTYEGRAANPAVYTLCHS